VKSDAAARASPLISSIKGATSSTYYSTDVKMFVYISRWKTKIFSQLAHIGNWPSSHIQSKIIALPRSHLIFSAVIIFSQSNIYTISPIYTMYIYTILIGVSSWRFTKTFVTFGTRVNVPNLGWTWERCRDVFASRWFPYMDSKRRKKKRTTRYVFGKHGLNDGFSAHVAIIR
jgi:hypothetical protein